MFGEKLYEKEKNLDWSVPVFIEWTNQKNWACFIKMKLK